MKTKTASLFALAFAMAYCQLPASYSHAQKLPVAKPEQSLTLKTDGKQELEFKQPGSPNIVRATTVDGHHVDISFNKDASKVTLLLSTDVSSDQLRVFTTEESALYVDGTIVFSALDAEVHGERAKLETHPGSHRIGFWSNENDYVTWTFKPQRWGRYEVELLYSQAGPSGNEVYASFATADKKELAFDKTLTASLDSTDSWYTYRVAKLGQLYIDDQNFRKPITLQVGSKKKVANAVMNLKAVVLRPTFEGVSMIKPDGAGKLSFHSKNSTVYGVQLVYEPNPKKNTLGWWVVPTDKARWHFKLDKPRTFSVQVLQGCGKGQGGSKVAVEVLHENAPTVRGPEDDAIRWTEKKVEFEVEDTGHFQNYKSRNVGQLNLESGEYILQVRPLSIAKNAVMDLRELALEPVKEE